LTQYIIFTAMVALAPFSLFRFGLPSRYLYLSAAGFASAHSASRSGRSSLRAPFVRGAAFTVRNVGVSAVASRPFDACAAELRAIDPASRFRRHVYRARAAGGRPRRARRIAAAVDVSGSESARPAPARRRAIDRSNTSAAGITAVILLIFSTSLAWHAF
jgi:hypothetical protein